MSIMLFIGIYGCKKDIVNSLTDAENPTSLLKNAFDAQIATKGMKYDDLSFNENFRTEVSWENIKFKTADTAIIPVKTLEDVKVYTNDSIPLDLNNNLIIKATKNEKGEWQFVKVIFLPEFGNDLPEGFTGRIISEGYFDKNITVIKYYGGQGYFSIFNSDNTWLNSNFKRRLKAGGSLGDPRCQPEEDDRVVHGYVEDHLNTVWHFPKTTLPHAACNDDPILLNGGNAEIPPYGTPSDVGGGNGTIGSNPIAQKFDKNDPCANKKELNNRKKNSKILAKNNEIKNLTLNEGPGKGLEHGYNSYINLNNGNITRFTNVEVGYSTGGGSQEVPSYEAWNWLPNNQVEVTADYSHTHPFQSGPSAMDVFSGIFPYMATSTGNMTTLSTTQKQVYLNYHSINVMTTNHDYAITITDPAKWVSRYPNMAADQDKFRDLFRKYEKSGYDGHTAQELALLDLYGDMIQLYRSDVGKANFEPVIYKIDSKTLKKIISNINC